MKKTQKKGKNVVAQPKNGVRSRTKVPKTVQQTIPYLAAYSCGTIQVAPTKFARAYLLPDINFRTLGEEDQELIFERFTQLLNSTSNFDIQIATVNHSVNVEEFKEKYFLKFKGDKLDVYRNEVNEIMLKNLNVGNGIKSDKYFVATVNADDIDEAMHQFTSVDTVVADSFRSVGCNDVQPLTMEKWLEVLHAIYHPGHTEEFLCNFKAMKKNGTTSKDIIAPDSMQVKPDKLMIGDKYAASLALTVYPSSLTTEFFADLSEIPCHLTSAMHLTAINQEAAVKMVRNQLVNINTNILEQQKKASQKGYSASLISPDLEAARDEAMEILDDITGKNQRLYYGTLAVSVFADTEEQLSQLIKLVQTVGQKHMCVFKKLQYQQDNGLHTSMPLGLNDLPIKRLLTTDSAALFIPFSAEDLSHDSGLYYGLNAITNNMIIFNRLRSRNSNGVILGTPGSGKSFSAKREILSVLLGTDADVYIVDPECEYAPLAELLGGEVIRIAAGSSVYINPLDMDIKFADEDDPVTLKADFMCAICETVIGGRYGLDPIQKSIIDRCVREIYKPYMEYLHQHPDITCAPDKTPTLVDFYERLLAQPEPEAQGIALALELYCTGSLDTFAHRTNVNTSSRFIIYDIKSIGSGLKELGLQVCLNDIWNKTIANKSLSKRTWFYLDEFYLLTQTESSARFLQQIWKRARKWGGVPTGITQNVEDLLASNEARSIISNCDFVLMLNQAPVDRVQLAEMFHIGESMQKYITNSDPGHGLIYTGRTIVPFVDKYPKDTQSFRVMTTNPEDVAAFKAEQEAKKNIDK